MHQPGIAGVEPHPALRDQAHGLRQQAMLDLVDEPLAALPLERVRPGRQVLDEVMDSLR